MRPQLKPTFVRSASAWSLAIALLLLACFSIFQAKALQDGLADHELNLTEEELDRMVEGVEEFASLQTTLWLSDLAETNSLQAIEELEESLRLQNRAFDAFYVWDPAAKGKFLYPFPARSPDDARRQATICLSRSSDLSRQLSPARSAMNLRACFDEEPTLRLQGALDEAEALLKGQRPQAALQAIRKANFAFNTSLNPDRSPIPAKDISEARLMVARAMHDQGYPEAALRQLKDLLRDISMQSGATQLYLLEHLEDRVMPILREWKATELIDQAQTALERGRRRLAGFAALRLHMTASAPPIGDDPRLIYGAPGEAPFLTAYAKTTVSGLHGAVQFDQRSLLQTMLNQAGNERGNLVIQDSRGTWLAGADPSLEVLVEVPFKRFLPHLRLGTVSLLRGDTAPAYRANFIWQILPILIAALLGALALLVRSRADRQERELRLRQQEFATRVTHELKTPLAGIRLMAENLEMGAVKNPLTAQEFAERIVTESERLTQRVDEILQSAKRPTVGEKQSIELQDMLLDLVEEWEPRFEDAGLILDSELGPCDPLFGEPEALRDAFSNLLDNALKYHRPEITEPQATIRLFQEGRTACVEVMDNGLGVPAEKRKVIFERFSRVEGPGRGKAGGHGLGLSFAKEAILLHRGTIICKEGLDGGGACFTVRIPIAPRR
ncbi:MAG: HAMP domain-containing sensor histidine kinase [Myxococcota bacterium]|nr:HAMP domain-containing sensor histidine kinase [Myxococcota bacterium]